MIPRVVLLIAQIAIAWFVAPLIRGSIAVPGNLQIFVLAAIFAVIVYIVGVLGAEILKHVGRPSGATLLWSLLGALLAAAAFRFAPQAFSWLPLNPKEYAVPLAGAVVGYIIKR